MSQPTNAPATKPAEATPAQNTAAPATAPAVTPAVDPRAEFSATLKRFAEKFGAANGAQWAAEGLTYEQALEKHAEAIATQLTAEQGKTKELETKLAAVPRGEAAPVSFSTTEKHPGGGNQTGDSKNLKLGGAIAKFAAGINLPK